jgi:hypothetical protein
MEMNKLYLHIIFAVMLMLPLSILAQEDWEKPAGGIEDAEIIIEKDKIISLRPVSRRFKAIQIEIPQPKPLTLSYSLKTALDSLPPLQVIVRPRTMKDQPLEKFYGFNAKLGYGNYNSPYALINIGTKRSDEYMLNASFTHYSSSQGPVLDDFSGGGVTDIGVSGKYFLNSVVLAARVNYNLHTYSIYGYDPVEFTNSSLNQDDLKQKLNNYSLILGLSDNNIKNNSNHDLNIGINYLQNNHPASEFLFDFIFMFII